ncbi:hypothetical protein [Cupriavidus sp. DF5525]|uniref:hypothetical protein n=1 Tax=Cupriavidus sp. DF5525 TaxID=3160989 RepID=UPI0005A0B2EA
MRLISSDRPLDPAAVAVETWAEFGEIGAALVRHAGFRAAADAPHRFYYATLMRNYSEAGNIDRVFELDEAVFAALGYDPDAAGVLLLGADIAKLAKRATLAQCRAILDHRLAMHMARTRPNVEEGKALADHRLLGILARGLRG